jgi:hypothetical protein
LQRGTDVRFRHVDNPPLGSTPDAPSPGDMAIIRGAVRDTANRRAGRLRATFIRLAGQRRHVDRVDAVFSVAGGTIVVAGLSNGGVDNLAVTGGTGRYAGARGTLRTTPT